MHYNVLIVDDEETLANMTAEYFNVFGVTTETANSRESCLDFLKNNQTDLILLDINLVKSNGFDLCKVIRKDYDTPIFFISARVSTNDMLIALNIGGDDYITKPYELSVLLAKVKARLKRDENKKVDSQTVKNIRLDFAKLKAYYKDVDLNLKAKEFKLLSFFITNKNKAVTKEEILENVWGDTFITDGALSVQISRLREKLAEADYIKTVWGKGYIFEVES